MKITLITTISLFLIAFTANAIAPNTQTTQHVLDIKGRKLQKGTKYYILPVIRGRGGGLKLGNPRNKTCPLDVVQDRFEVSNGLPLTFSPVNSGQRFITLSTDLNIQFSASNTCARSTVWQLDTFDDTLKQWFVTTGGVKGNPGPSTISNWFKIERYSDTSSDIGDYKLVFCPTVCNFCKVICRDVGVFIKDGIRRLALSDTTPLAVMFKRA